MKDNLPNRMLHLMSDGSWYSTQELVEKISHRFSATKHVLEKRGYQFRKRPVGNRQHEYQLVKTERNESNDRNV